MSAQRFGMGVAVGIVLGALLPALAQNVSQILPGNIYGVARGSPISIFCAEQAGNILAGSALSAEPVRKPVDAASTGFGNGFWIECI